MCVAPVVSRIGQRDARLVIELDEDHWAVDAVVERAYRIELANPCENSFIEVLPDLIQTNLRVSDRKPIRVQRDQFDELTSLCRCHSSDRQTFIMNYNVVLEARGVTVEWEIHPNHRLGALFRGQRIHERPTYRLFVTQDSGAFVYPRFGEHRF